MNAMAPVPLPEPWQGETYHGRPTLKPAEFDWKVATYIAVQGVAGAAQLLAGISRTEDPEDRDGLASRARALAFAGSIIAPAILIGHLKTPKRWYNMLRIVRPQSPMSWGSWVLTAFGAASFAAWGAERMGWRRAADLAQIPASLAGAGAASYTATLLSTTSNPLWAAARAPLAAQFAASSMAGGAAAMALLQRSAGKVESARRLERLSAAALGAETAASMMLSDAQRRAGVSAPLKKGPPALLHKAGAQALGIAAPLVLRALGRPALASAAILIGSALLRQAVLRAGDESAKRPLDSLGFAREVRR
ncbi:NrfD/PsrC family molybdoenzyme membrane anchor subunit [Sabulicella rubraurantiaca]|uniref:NrfD/PsrC family molybdoenzyme membrane anchor subunit n=1 Tax=Sabulicella rubraurantiaca TaxID=2811429 RepID=UPI001A971F4A|nr:NrfD/PsrC family molybdoenzyme membrane anchor subunit [Sabulicella rubraurantiaca]